MSTKTTLTTHLEKKKIKIKIKIEVGGSYQLAYSHIFLFSQVNIL
jgi:hypothetical protein